MAKGKFAQNEKFLLLTECFQLYLIIILYVYTVVCYRLVLCGKKLKWKLWSCFVNLNLTNKKSATEGKLWKISVNESKNNWIELKKIFFCHNVFKRRPKHLYVEKGLVRAWSPYVTLLINPESRVAKDRKLLFNGGL